MAHHLPFYWRDGNWKWDILACIEICIWLSYSNRPIKAKKNQLEEGAGGGGGGGGVVGGCWAGGGGGGVSFVSCGGVGGGGGGGVGGGGGGGMDGEKAF